MSFFLVFFLEFTLNNFHGDGCGEREKREREKKKREIESLWVVQPSQDNVSMQLFSYFCLPGLDMRGKQTHSGSDTDAAMEINRG